MNGGETVTLVSRAKSGRDAYGNDVYVDTSTDVHGCIVWISSTSEDATQASDQVKVGLTVLLPAGTSVSPTDRFLVRGVTYEVDGEPFDFTSPFTGTRPGVEVHLTRYTG